MQDIVPGYIMVTLFFKEFCLILLPVRTLKCEKTKKNWAQISLMTTR